MLSLTITRAALLDALAPAAKVVERRNTIPILSNALLRAEGESLSVTTTDLDIEFVTQVPAEVKEAGAITVPAGPLADIARKLASDAKVSIETLDSGQIAVRAGRSRFVLGTLPEGDFPEFKEIADSHALSLTLPAKTLKGLLARTAFAISTEETRYYLNGTFLEGVDTDEGPALRAVATDGWRLARIDATGVCGLQVGAPGVIVPRKAVHEMIRLADEAGDAEIHLAITLATITLRVAGTKLSSKLIDGTFPDYRRVIPSANDKHVLAPLDALKRAVDRVGLLASDRGRAVKLSLEGESLTVSLRNPDAGEAVDGVDVEYAGAPLDIGLNGRFLVDMLDQVGGDTARLAFADPGSPVLVRPREGDDALFVLMPMRV